MYIYLFLCIFLGSGKVLDETLSKVVETITEVDWKIQDGENEVLSIEHAGIHMALKKLAQHDKVASANGKVTFGTNLVDTLTDKVVSFFTIFIYRFRMFL